jgi:hypothetical protein
MSKVSELIDSDVKRKWIADPTAAVIAVSDYYGIYKRAKK